MNKDLHHELCMGLLAQCYRYVPSELKIAIEQGVQAAVDNDLCGMPKNAVLALRTNSALRGSLQ